MTPADLRRGSGGALTRLPERVRDVVRVALGKKARDVVVLDLRRAAAFTDYFILCSGNTVRQVQAIADAVQLRLREAGTRPAHIEGYQRAEWVLLDCFDLVVHVFTPETRAFYALERLWGSADRIDVPDDERA